MTASAYVAGYLGEGELEATSAPWGGRLADLLVFIIPASQCVEFHIVGTLFAPDIVLLALFPVVLRSKAHILNKRLPRTFLVLGFIWLAGQVATDVTRSMPFHDYARGWTMIAFTLMNFSVLYVLLFQNARRILLYTLGFAIGGLLTYFLNPGIFAAGDPWKFGYGFGVTVLVVLIATVAAGRSKGSVAAVVMLIATALNLYNDFRSLAGVCFMVAGYLLIEQLARTRRGYEMQLSLAGRLVVYALLAVSAAGLLRIYEYCAGKGLLGYAAWQKYEIESSGRYGILVGGRTEFLVGLQAALDSPIIGHGSWAKDWQYAGRTESVQADAGYMVVGASDSWGIPSHSHLVGAWVDAGILGALFWVWVLSLPLRVLTRLYAVAEPLAPLIAFLAIILVWEVLFSPYGAERRFITPYYVVVMMTFLSKAADLRLTAQFAEELWAE